MRDRYGRPYAVAHLPRALAAGLAVAVLATGVTGCRSPDAPTPLRWTITASAPREQVGLAGGEVTPPAVRVIDSSGAPAAGVAVGFLVEEGGGSVDGSEVTTDVAGSAAALRWRLGGAPGLQRVRAVVMEERRASAGFAVTAIPPAGPLDADARCVQPDSLRPAGWALPRTTERIARRLPLTVVAIGSSSTQGTGASVPDSAYPALVDRHLRRLFPASAVTVHNAGRGGERLDQLQLRFGTDVTPKAPHLVILQTGTIDAIQGVDRELFVRRLRDALAELEATGADVVMLDAQRYPNVGESPSYRAFQQSMRQVGAERGVPVVRRYDVMTHWVANGIYAYPQILAPDMFHPSDLTYSCTARAIAEGIHGAVRALAGR